MRVYINQEERNFLINMFLEYIEDFLADVQCSEDSEYDEPDEINVINSLLNKLNNEPKRNNIKIRYIYEKISKT